MLNNNNKHNMFETEELYPAGNFEFHLSLDSIFEQTKENIVEYY